MEGFKSKVVNPSGKRSIVFNRSDAFLDLPITVPCGQCIGCRLEKSRQWAVRCVHEASLHTNNCFVTLTYNDEHLPPDNSLQVRHLQLFLKKLRKKYGSGIRFFACGEYGEKYFRPHYHICLFNHHFPDQFPFKKSRDNVLYRSPELEKIWDYGHSSIGDLTFQSAAYTARYVLKKINGEHAEEYYQWVDQHGEVHQMKPEFTTMSRRPGIASDWYKKYKKDIYPDDFVVLNNKKFRPPKFYDLQYEVEFPSDLKKLKSKRKKGLKKHQSNNTRQRLKVREIIQQKKADRLIRPTE